MDMSKSRIGFVGVGRMGANMALRLHDLGYAVTAVYDVRAESARELAPQVGAEATTSLTRVTELADVIFTVVSDDAAMAAIFGEGGDTLLAGAKNKAFINCATLSPRVHVDVERAVEAKGGTAIEACMASSITQARNGTLYLMIGGRRETFERVKSLLEQMSTALRYIGPAGTAAQVKALVNMVMNINTAGLAEGLGLGDALGLDLTMLREIFSQTGAASRVLETDGGDMQSREHDVYFSAAHAAKDTHIATALAHNVGLHLPLAEATAKQFDAMSDLGIGELDKSGVAELTFLSRRARALAART
jgi:3-hydroxyisobutyrate dehydrogenase